MNADRPVLVIDNSALYRYLLPIAPFGVVFAFLSAACFNFPLLLDVGMGLCMGVFLSELIYHRYASRIHFFADRLIEKLTFDEEMKRALDLFSAAKVLVERPDKIF